MNAVRLDRFGMVVFTPAEVSEDLRRSICEDLDGQVLENIRLDLPDDRIPAGYNLSRIDEPSALRSFITELRNLDQIASDTDEADTDEAWAEILRDLNGISLHTTWLTRPARARG